MKNEKFDALSDQQKKRVLLAKSADEIMGLAKMANIDITKEEAEEFYRANSNRELSEDELELTSGGSGNCTSSFRYCPTCGSSDYSAVFGHQEALCNKCGTKFWL